MFFELVRDRQDLVRGSQTVTTSSENMKLVLEVSFFLDHDVPFRTEFVIWYSIAGLLEILQFRLRKISVAEEAVRSVAEIVG